jgi:hypothetical protein
MPPGLRPFAAKMIPRIIFETPPGLRPFVAKMIPRIIFETPLTP